MPAADDAGSPVNMANTPNLNAMALGAGGAVYRELDATLGHEGLPQSATGQTSLLTGRNAADAMGGHYGPWPGPTLRRLLDEGSLFSLGQLHGGASLANAYPPGYFAAMGTRRYRQNAFAYAATAAGVEQLGTEEYEAGRAVPSDLEGEHLGAAIGLAGSAAALARLAATSAFTALDVWLTDRFGHSQDATGGAAILERVDALVGALASELGRDVTLALTSDHGNLEDVSVPAHTRNPVPLYAKGPRAGAFRGVADLMGFYRAAAEVLSG